MKSLLRSKFSPEEKTAFEAHYVEVCAQWFDNQNRSDFSSYFTFRLTKIISLPDCLRAIEIADFLQKPEFVWKKYFGRLVKPMHCLVQGERS